LIDTLELHNFTAFNHVELKFSPKINVIIGENGTGKTHLLKAAYALCCANNHLTSRVTVSKKDIADAITTKLVRLFLPLDDKLGSMHRNGAKTRAELKASFIFGKTITVGFSNRSKLVSILQSDYYERYSWKPVFIPTKEVLSLLPGITSSDQNLDLLRLLFDDTYLDLCASLLDSSHFADTEVRIDREPRFGSVYSDITAMIGGQYSFSNGDFRFIRGSLQERKVPRQHKYGVRTETVFRPARCEGIANNMTAEGFRKIGILQQLLKNRTLIPGASGPLFWDEPESNLNPKLMKFLVESLLQLSRNGQQIIIATHDYVVLKWLDLLMDRKGKDDHVKYHALYRDSAGNLKSESTETYTQLDENAISSVYSDLYDASVEHSFKGAVE
jgi:predicted ATPase